MIGQIFYVIWHHIHHHLGDPYPKLKSGIVALKKYDQSIHP